MSKQWYNFSIKGDEMNNLKHVIKGIIIGIATLVPGVSGGTMAIILGVYDDMIHAVGSFFKNIKKNIVFLGTLGVGGVIGIALFSRVIEYGLEHFKYPIVYLFLGIIIGGIPVLYKRATTGKKKMSDYIYFIVGLLLIVGMSLYNVTIVNLASSTGIWNFIFLIVAGIIIAVALILPGISTSFMLLALGLYDITLKAINTVDIPFLLPIVIGAALGVIGTTKVLENLLNNKPRQTYMLILGFVVGSIIEVFPGIPTSFNILYSIITFVIGYLLIQFMSKKYSD